MLESFVSIFRQSPVIPIVLPEVPPPLTMDDVAFLNNLHENIKNLKPGDKLEPEERKELKDLGFAFPEKYNFSIIGLQHAGKSSFINTLIRIMKQEFGRPFCGYVQAAPKTDDHCTKKLERIIVPNCNFRLFDCQGINSVDPSNHIEFIKLCFNEGVEPGCSFSLREAVVRPDPDSKFHGNLLLAAKVHLDTNTFHTGIKALCKELNVGDRRPILLLSYKDILNNSDIIKYRTYMRDIAGSDLVYCIANYVVPSTADPASFIPIRRRDTEETVLQIIEKCFFEADRCILIKEREKAAIKRAQK